MAPDFTAFVLQILNSNWSSPPSKPQLIDRRDTSRMGPRQPDVAADLTVDNAVGVGAGPTTNNTATGFGFNYTYSGGADVRIRALNANEGGHVGGTDEWSALVGAVRDTINAQRRWPIPDPDGNGGAYTLMIENENDRSQEFQDLYWYEFDTMFTGRERL